VEPYQAVLLAGDRGAARAVRGRSKAFVEIAGKPMVVHVLETLLHTPEISEVYVVGDAPALERAIARHGCLRLAAARSRPIHVVPQRQNLYENVWHTFLRTLPAGQPEDHAIVVVPADVPLMIPEEVSSFVRQAAERDADYVVGLSPEAALRPFAPHDGQPGIQMAYFNLAEGRFRQNNLHFVRALRMGNRHYIQDMYENRYQKQVGNMLRLGWRIARREYRNLWVIFYYLLMHLSGVLDRRGRRRGADRLRRWVPLATVERGIGALLRTRFATVLTGYGGAALDVDNDADLEIVDKMLAAWKERQARQARAA
jgi:GTP:adenosylcobinamide-phosphate guanylyltransferase